MINNNNKITIKNYNNYHVDSSLHCCTRYHYAHHLTDAVYEGTKSFNESKRIKVYLCGCKDLKRKDGCSRKAKNLKKKALYLYRGKPYTYNSVMGITKNKRATEKVLDFRAFRDAALRKGFSFDAYTGHVSTTDIISVPSTTKASLASKRKITANVDNMAKKSSAMQHAPNSRDAWFPAIDQTMLSTENDDFPPFWPTWDVKSELENIDFHTIMSPTFNVNMNLLPTPSFMNLLPTPSFKERPSFHGMNDITLGLERMTTDEKTDLWKCLDECDYPPFR